MKVLLSEFHKERDGIGWTNTKDECVGNAKVGCVPGPERVEVDRRADLPAVEHLDGLAVQLRQHDVRCCSRVRRRDLCVRGKGGKCFPHHMTGM